MLHGERLARAFATLAEFAPRMHFLVPPFTWRNIVAGLEAIRPQLLLVDYLQRVGPPVQCDGIRAAAFGS